MQNDREAVRQPGGQKYLGSGGLIAFIALLSAFVPLSTDLYLPALPTMARYFNAPQALVNLTLILFFVFYSAGTLFWGPLSDKYGRKPVILSGLVLYLAAGVLCAVSLNIYLLVLFRVLQAVGGSAASAVATAIVKDVYSGRKRESVLALVQSMVVISPAIAPVLGALLLRLTSWRGIFVSLAVIGLIALTGAVALQETSVKSTQATVRQSIGRLGVVLRNLGFSSMLVIFSLASVATMAFISSSSYIFQNGFGLSGQVYSYFFTFNAVGMLLGPLLYMRLSARFRRRRIVSVCFAVMAVSGGAVCLLGSMGPWFLVCALVPSTVASSCIRPPATYLMLEQQTGDTGSASSLMGAFSMLMGSAGMMLVSFNWSRPVVVVGAVNVAVGIVCGLLWAVFYKKPYIRHFSEISAVADQPHTT